MWSPFHIVLPENLVSQGVTSGNTNTLHNWWRFIIIQIDSNACLWRIMCYLTNEAKPKYDNMILSLKYFRLHYHGNNFILGENNSERVIIITKHVVNLHKRLKLISNIYSYFQHLESNYWASWAYDVSAKKELLNPDEKSKLTKERNVKGNNAWSRSIWNWNRILTGH